MQKITPFLWFNTEAEAAAKFYTSIFKNSKILNVSRYNKAAESASGKQAGTVMTVEFKLQGQKFVALNGGPHFKFTEAISFVVSCRTQAEVDWFWKRLSAGGHESQCGWLKDKFGVSWQIVPGMLGEVLGGSNPAGAQAAMTALLQMRKLDIAELKRAYASAGKPKKTKNRKQK